METMEATLQFWAMYLSIQLVHISLSLLSEYFMYRFALPVIGTQ